MPGKKFHGAGRKGDIHDMVFSTQRARELLDWTPTVSLERGLRQTVAAFTHAI